jgi:type VI secretion system protein ImpF
MESTVDISEAEYVRKSILNFGLPDISSHTIDEVGMREVPEEIRLAIVNYEPRLAAESLTVERDLSVSVDELKVRFIVRADLTCDPVPVPVEFVADITETGNIVLNRR